MSTLSLQRAQALFDILSHHETYNSIKRFKYPDGIDNYGPPFDISGPSTSPILQTLLYRFILTLPGICDVPPDFWRDKIKPTVKAFGAANLSESYEQGGIGLRKVLATGISALLEYPARGCFGGLNKYAFTEVREDYDVEDAEDIEEAWNELLHQVVYGPRVDQLFSKVEETDELRDHEPLVQAAHEYILLNVASVLHYVFHSPDGPYLTQLIQSIHKLIPYIILRQTLRMSNVASMINALTRVLLAKLSVTSITNYFGLTNNPDDGMNLVQQIISTILTWDVNECQKRLTKIEKSKDSPGQGYLDSITEHVYQSREEREDQRARSEKESKSIVTIIFEDAFLGLDTVTDEQHTLAATYLSTRLSMRDREQLSQILCHQTPDLITQAIREAVAAFDPVIRALHNAVDLSGTMTDIENFVTDLVDMTSKDVKAKTRKYDSEQSSESEEEEQTAKIEDFVSLLKKHQKSLHRFLHQMAQNGGEVTQQYREYVIKAAAQFRRSQSQPSENHGQQPEAGDMTPHLQKIFNELPIESRSLVADCLDNHTAYLMALDATSKDRMNALLSGEDSPTAGPGTYLARWQQLLDASPVTPETSKGPVRFGSSRTKTLGNGAVESEARSEKSRRLSNRWDFPQPPDNSKVVELLGTRFREVLGELGEEHWNDS